MSHGGRRPRAGRKKGSGRYGEPTRAIRVPISRVDEVLRLCQDPTLTVCPKAKAKFQCQCSVSCIKADL